MRTSAGVSQNTISCGYAGQRGAAWGAAAAGYSGMPGRTTEPRSRRSSSSTSACVIPSASRATGSSCGSCSATRCSTRALWRSCCSAIRPPAPRRTRSGHLSCRGTAGRDPRRRARSRSATARSVNRPPSASAGPSTTGSPVSGKPKRSTKLRTSTRRSLGVATANSSSAIRPSSAVLAVASCSFARSPWSAASRCVTSPSGSQIAGRVADRGRLELHPARALGLEVRLRDLPQRLARVGGIERRHALERHAVRRRSAGGTGRSARSPAASASSCGSR